MKWITKNFILCFWVLILIGIGWGIYAYFEPATTDDNSYYSDAPNPYDDIYAP